MQGDIRRPKSHIEELEKQIYRRDRTSPTLPREELLERPHAALPMAWEHIDALSHDEIQAVRSSFFRNLFLGALAFFLLAAGFGAYVIFGGSDSVSAKNLDISVIGPSNIAAGAPLELQVAVRNKNSAQVENAQLVVEYPDGTKAASSVNKDLSYEKDSLGTLASGALAQHTISALLYGDKDTVAHIKLTVEYNLKGSNTLFYADSGYDVTISSSPVSVTVNALDQVTSGQQVVLAVNVVSNSTTIVRSVLLRGTYPFGFTPTIASPQPADGGSTWSIGDMQPGDKRTITVVGTLSAQDGESRVFKFQAGTASDSDAHSIGTSFLVAQKSITVEKPFLGVDVAVNGTDAKTYASAPQATVPVDITYTNNTSSEIDNALINVKLNGTLYDKQSIAARGGFYRSADNSITWDHTTNPELAAIAPGATGKVSFEFKTLPVTTQNASVSQPQVSFDVNVSGKRLGDSSAEEAVAAIDSRVVKISSKLGLVSRIVYSTGPFRNAGQIPPRADHPVTYTVIWSITNTSNDISGAKIVATLPNYVSWLGTSLPAGEKIAFDPVTRAIEWDPGTIQADAGVTKSAREIAFQVSYLPSVSQLGTVPVLVIKPSLSGTDTWTGVSLSDQREDLTTRLSTDPNFIPGQDEVTN